MAYLDDCMKKCPICGKEFCVTYAPQWAYKVRSSNGYTLFCSWKCLNKGKSKINSNRKYKSVYTNLE